MGGLATKPPATGSVTLTKTTGMSRVNDHGRRGATVPELRMTSGERAISSAQGFRLLGIVAERAETQAIFLPSFQPSAFRPFRKASARWRDPVVGGTERDADHLLFAGLLGARAAGGSSKGATPHQRAGVADEVPVFSFASFVPVGRSCDGRWLAGDGRASFDQFVPLAPEASSERSGQFARRRAG